MRIGRPFLTARGQFDASDGRMDSGAAGAGQVRNGASAAFLRDGGEMGALMRAHDWAATPLGPPETWPLPLRTLLRVLLNTGHPMYLFWGPELLCFYNDAYSQSIGPEKHPGSLGRPGREVWDEAWHIIGPQIDHVMSGGPATWHENALVPIDRNGRREEVYWTYSYSPVDDPENPGGVGGVLVTCSETTRTVLAERRRATEAARQRRLLEQAPAFIIVMRGPEHVVEFVNEAHKATFGSGDWVGRPIREAFPSIAGQGFFAALDDVYATGVSYQANDAPVTFRRDEAEPPATRRLTFIYAPLFDDSGAVNGIFCEGFDVTATHRAQELAEGRRQQLELVVGELNHRVKNTLTIVQSLAQQTFRGVSAAAEAREVFDGRLVALASAHSLLTDTKWGATDLEQLIRRAMSGLSIDPDRLDVHGVPAAVAPDTTLLLAMVLHELGTNARKYGAWSNETGRVAIRWSVESGHRPRLSLRWQESGGPPTSAPKRQGFGTRMIDRVLAKETDAYARLEFKPDGVVCTIGAPLAPDMASSLAAPEG